MFQRLLDGYCRFLSTITVACLAVMVIMVFGNVVLRYGFNSGIAVSEELSRWLFLWVVFLGATVAVHERTHMGTDMLVRRLPPRVQQVVLAFGLVLMLFVTWLMFSGSLTQTRINWDVEAPVTGASLAWVYSAGLVFAVSSGVMLLADLWRTLCGRLSFDSMSKAHLAPSDEAGPTEPTASSSSSAASR